MAKPAVSNMDFFIAIVPDSVVIFSDIFQVLSTVAPGASVGHISKPCSRWRNGTVSDRIPASPHGAEFA